MLKDASLVWDVAAQNVGEIIMSKILKKIAEDLLKKGEHVADSGFSAEESKKVAKQLGLDFSKEEFSFEEFHKGINVELEHSNVTKKSPTMSAKIALAHLKEDPHYYKKLEKVEGD